MIYQNQNSCCLIFLMLFFAGILLIPVLLVRYFVPLAQFSFIQIVAVILIRSFLDLIKKNKSPKNDFQRSRENSTSHTKDCCFSDNSPKDVVLDAEWKVVDSENQTMDNQDGGIKQIQTFEDKQETEKR